MRDRRARFREDLARELAVYLRHLGALAPTSTSAEPEVLVESVANASGVREIYAAATQLAMHGSRARTADRLLLVLWSPRVSKATLEAMWSELRAVFTPAIARKLQLVATWPTDELVLPDDEGARALADRLRGSVKATEAPRPDLSFEVLRILLVAWATDRRFVPIGALQAATGLSYPTVARSLAALDEVLERSSSRSVRLRAFPEEPWSRLLALAPRVRQTLALEDRSGRSTAHDVLARARRLRTAKLAVGGVEAARHWHRALALPPFDLDGIPRLDLTVHAPGGLDRDLVRKLDPALVPARPGQAPLVVLHVLHRAADAFDRTTDTTYTDIIETLLDLAEQRTLRKQYGELLAHLRKR